MKNYLYFIFLSLAFSLTSSNDIVSSFSIQLETSQPCWEVPSFSTHDTLPITPENVDQIKQLADLGCGTIMDLHWMPDGKTLSVLSTAGIWMYDTATPDGIPRRIEMQTGWVSAMALSPNGAILATGGREGQDEFLIKLWDTRTGIQLALLAGHASEISHIVFSLDGTRLASGDNRGNVRVWDVKTGDELFLYEGHSSSVIWPSFLTTLEFSPDGQTLISGDRDGTLQLWDSSTGNRLFTVTNSPDNPIFARFNLDGTLLASWTSNGMVLWDAHTGEKIVELPIYLTSLAFSADSRLLAVGDVFEHTISLWDTHTGQKVDSWEYKNEGWISDLDFNSEGLLAAATTDGIVQLWDIETGSQVTTWTGYLSNIYDVAVSPDGAMLASGNGDATIHLWNLESRTELAVLRGHNFRVNSVSFSPDGTLLASASQGDEWGTAPGSIRLWNVASLTPVAVVASSQRSKQVAFSPDGATLAYPATDFATGLNYVQLWNVRTHTDTSILQGPTDYITSVAFSPYADMLASASWDGTVWLWDTETHNPILQIKGNEGKDLFSPDGSVEVVAFSPDETLLATGNGNGIVDLWDLKVRRHLVSLETDSSELYRLAFSPDSKLLATPGEGDQGLIYVWETATGKLAATLVGHNGLVYGLTFSPDGTSLISAGEDGTIRIWGLSRH